MDKSALLAFIVKAVREVPEVKQHLSNKARWILATKGGEGSGNFGHEGRPGLVGGSGSGWHSAYNKALQFTKKTKREYGFVIDENDNIVYEAKGTKKSVYFPAEAESQKYPNHISVHTHPNGMTFSSQDIGLFLQDKFSNDWRVIDVNGSVE